MISGLVRRGVMRIGRALEQADPTAKVRSRDADPMSSKASVARTLVRPVIGFGRRCMRGIEAIRTPYGPLSYSQFGEDLMLTASHKLPRQGFYVDVGAGDPRVYSNTYMLYRKGWRGIAIEPNPLYVHAYRKFRKDDIHVCEGVSSQNAEMTYFMFNDPILNTFDESLARLQNERDGFRLTNTTTVRTRPLADILKEYLSLDQKIDLMNIDAEGLDFEIVLSNDWTKWRPQLILVEIFGQDISEIMKSRIYLFVRQIDYLFIGRTGPTCLFLAEEHMNTCDSLTRHLRTQPSMVEDTPREQPLA